MIWQQSSYGHFFPTYSCAHTALGSRYFFGSFNVFAYTEAQILIARFFQDDTRIADDV